MVKWRESFINLKQCHHYFIQSLKIGVNNNRNEAWGHHIYKDYSEMSHCDCVPKEGIAIIDKIKS